MNQTLSEEAMSPIILRPLGDMLETEETDARHVQNIASRITRAGVWTTPICIERESRAVMDGHHRLAAARLLGLQFIPAKEFTYEQVELKASREGYEVSPEEILRRALDRELYPVKTTHHTFPGTPATCLIPLTCLRPNNGFEQHLSWIWDGREPPHVQAPGARYRRPSHPAYKAAA